MKLNVLLTINCYSYDAGLIRRLSDIYSSAISKIHVSIMGHKCKEIRQLLESQQLESITETTVPGFNYSYAINKTFQKLQKDGSVEENDILVLTDSWSVVSLMQLEAQLRNFNFEKTYMTVEIYKDAPKDPINTESKRLMLSVLARLKSIKDEKIPKPQKLIPVPLLSARILNMAGGLEERFFTDFSRLSLIEYLHKNDIKRIGGCHDGIRLSYESVYTDEETQRDVKSYNKLKELAGTKLTLPANVGISWGDVSSLKYLKREGNLLVWDIPKKDQKVFDISDQQKPQVSITKMEKPLSVPSKKKIPVLGITSSIQDSMLVVSNLLSNVVQATSILKRMYLQYGPVTVLTNKKLFKPISLLPKYMVKEILDYGDIQKSSIDFKKFHEINQVLNCGFNLEVDHNIINIIEDHSPCCSIETPKKIKPNTVVFCVSCKPDQYREYDTDIWFWLTKACTILSEYDIQVFLLGLEEERLLINPLEARANHKFIVEYNRPIEEVLSIINNCGHIICHTGTNMFWLGYVAKAETLIVSLGDNGTPIKDVSWVESVNVHNEDLMDEILKWTIITT